MINNVLHLLCIIHLQCRLRLNINKIKGYAIRLIVYTMSVQTSVTCTSLQGFNI